PRCRAACCRAWHRYSHRRPTRATAPSTGRRGTSWTCCAGSWRRASRPRASNTPAGHRGTIASARPQNGEEQTMSKQTSRSVTRRELVAGLAAGTAAVGLPLVGIGAEDKPSKLKVIVAGAHPDDPESAAGGTAARYADLGHDVVCLYLTRGEAGLKGKTA